MDLLAVGYWHFSSLQMLLCKTTFQYSKKCFEIPETRTYDLANKVESLSCSDMLLYPESCNIVVRNYCEFDNAVVYKLEIKFLG